jgi:hypothetical protein
MPITTRNYYRQSTPALETALIVLPDDSELYELIQDELDKRETESELFPQDDTPSLQDRGLNLGSYGS